MRAAFFILLIGMATTIVSCNKTPGERPAEPARPPIEAHPPAAPPLATPSAQEPPAAPAKAPEAVRSAGLVIEADMSPEFSSAFKASKECRGIELTARKERRDFKVYTLFMTADTPEMEEQWLWSIFDTRAGGDGKFRAAGNAPSVVEAIHDMCTEIWQTRK